MTADRSPRRKNPSLLACASAGDPLASIFPAATRLAQIAARLNVIPLKNSTAASGPPPLAGTGRGRGGEST